MTGRKPPDVPRGCPPPEAASLTIKPVSRSRPMVAGTGDTVAAARERLSRAEQSYRLWTRVADEAWDDVERVHARAKQADQFAQDALQDVESAQSALRKAEIGGG